MPHTLAAIDWVVLLFPHACYWLTSLFFEIGYNTGWLRQYAIQPGGHDDGKKQLASRAHVLATVLFQQCMMVAANWASVSFIDGSIAGKSWPPWSTCVAHFVIGMLLMDAVSPLPAPSPPTHPLCIHS